MKQGKEPSIPIKLMATPFRLSELVNVQEGAVVSRTIVNKPEGTVTMFAFDAGQRLSTHSAPFDAMVTIVEGRGTITIEDQLFELDAGQSIVMPANKPHSVEAREAFKMELIMIKARAKSE